MTIENVACIDLGSNSCRLTIANKQGQTLLKESERTALAEGLSSSGVLSDAAMKRGVSTLEHFAELMEKYHVKSYRAITTAACRMASNSDVFLEKVRQKAGIELEIIGPYEEARLNLEGALINAPKNFKYAIVYDLGGASTEITLSDTKENPHILRTISIPLGARNASELYHLNDYDPAKAKCLSQDVYPYVRDFVQESDLKNLRDKTCLIATSSTPLRLSAMAKDIGSYKREECDGAVLQASEADKVIQQIAMMDYEERASSVYIADRASIFVSACVIFKTVYDTLKFPEIIVSLKSAQDAMIKELCHGKDDKIGQTYPWSKSFDRSC